MSRLLVRDVMTRGVKTVAPETSFKEVATILVQNRVSAVPVVDGRGEVLGVVSELDLMHKIEFVGAEPQTRLFERKRERLARVKASADTAGELMTSPAVVVNEEASPVAAAAIMHAEGIKRLPVVNSTGKLVGIVTRGDVLRAFLRSDGAIQREVIEEVLRRATWLEPHDVTTTVKQGVVTLTGRTRRRSTAEMVIRMTHSVPGVAGVVNELTFVDDDIDGGGRQQSTVE